MCVRQRRAGVGREGREGKTWGRIRLTKLQIFFTCPPPVRANWLKRLGAQSHEKKKEAVDFFFWLRPRTQWQSRTETGVNVELRNREITLIKV